MLASSGADSTSRGPAYPRLRKIELEFFVVRTFAHDLICWRRFISPAAVFPPLSSVAQAPDRLPALVSEPPKKLDCH